MFLQILFDIKVSLYLIEASKGRKEDYHHKLSFEFFIHPLSHIVYGDLNFSSISFKFDIDTIKHNKWNKNGSKKGDT